MYSTRLHVVVKDNLTYNIRTMLHEKVMASGVLVPPKDAPSLSREPLIELPDRIISPIYTDHGEANLFGYEPFPDREVVEKEIQEVFPDGFDAIFVDSFPGEEKLTDRLIDRAFKMTDFEIDFHSWVMKFTSERETTIIAGDPIAHSKILGAFLTTEVKSANEALYKEDEDHYANLIRIRIDKQKQIRNDLCIDALESLLALTTRLGPAFSVLLVLELLQIIGEGTNALQGVDISRRDFIKLGVVTGGTAGIRIGAAVLENLLGKKIVEANDLANQRFLDEMEEVGKQLGPSPLEQFKADFAEMQKLFAQGKQLDSKDFYNPAVLRQSAAMEQFIISLGLRNALVAGVLKLSRSDILPWKNPLDRKAKIVLMMGFGHWLVPDRMRISYFLTHEEERRVYIEKILSSLANRERLVKEINHGSIYQIKPDGQFQESKYKISL